MTKRQQNYQDLLATCREQTTGWLVRCHNEPSQQQRNQIVALSRLAVRSALRERGAFGLPADISHITEYGITSRLQTPVRVF